MPAVKTYTRVNFQNYPSTSTPLNATNLNKMDKGIDDLDDEVVTVKNAIENMSFDADSISYDNTSSGLQATDVQGAVDEINDNLSGFKFYPIGTNLVALVADDSFYKDANDKYVLANSTTGQALIDGVTYKALASTEETHGEVGADTCSPFSAIKAPIEQIYGRSSYGRDSVVFGISNYNNVLNTFFGTCGSTLPTNNTLETMLVSSASSGGVVVKAKVTGKFFYSVSNSSDITRQGSLVYTESNFNAGDTIASTGSNYTVISVLYYKN